MTIILADITIRTHRQLIDIADVRRFDERQIPLIKEILLYSVESPLLSIEIVFTSVKLQAYQ